MDDTDDMYDDDDLFAQNTIYVNQHCQLRLHHTPEQLTLLINGSTTECRLAFTEGAAENILPLLNKADNDDEIQYTVEQIPRDHRVSTRQ